MKLVFPDGTEFEGKPIGFKKNIEAEVVFNTAMTGYVETLTDPSYCGQILVMTYPSQGNYGVPIGPYESDRIQPAGFIIDHLTQSPSHSSCSSTLGDWLNSQEIPGLFNVDTRSLTCYLREQGAVRAKLIYDESETLHYIDQKNVLNAVAIKSTEKHGKGENQILLIDTGCKNNIVRSLVSRGVTVISAPWNSNWEKYLADVSGIVLGNGPGDPADAMHLVERLKPLLNNGIPIFGICFGNQLLALTAGAKTKKMKLGHRSVNQPVKDLRTGKCYITSQNHGYVIDPITLPSDWEPWFVNLNDDTNEGIRHRTKPIFSVQFHPEASPGPHDTHFLFDEFINIVNRTPA